MTNPQTVGPSAKKQSSGPSRPDPDSLVEQLQRLLSLNEVILLCDGVEDLWPRVLDIALETTGASRSLIILRQSDSEWLSKWEPIASKTHPNQPASEPTRSVEASFVEKAFGRGKPIVAGDFDNVDWKARGAVLETRDTDSSLMAIPIRDSRGILGVLYLEQLGKTPAEFPELVELMDSFGHQVALAVRTVRLRQAYQKKAEKLEKIQDEFSEFREHRAQMLEELQERRDMLSKRAETGASDSEESFPNIAYTSKAMRSVLDKVQRIAKTEVSILIMGESGVGKELVARAIHNLSPRQGRFVSLNCGAVSQSLIESELFGHVEGAFTGANSDKEGMFEAAGGGTLFLDEVGEMPPSMQVKLLRTLEESRVRRVGSTESRSVDVRVVAATNQDLEAMVEREKFRQDLFYRLAAMSIEIPALRDRPEDIPVIARHLMSEISKKLGQEMRLDPGALRLLTHARWRGNVRELRNTLRTACGLAEGTTVHEHDIAPLITIQQPQEGSRKKQASGYEQAEPAGRDAAPKESSAGQFGHRSETNDRSVSFDEFASRNRGRGTKAGRREVRDALEQADGDLEKAAEHLGVSRRTMYRYLKRYEIDKP